MLGKIVDVKPIIGDTISQLASSIKREADYYQNRGFEVEIHYPSLSRGYTADYSALLICRESVKVYEVK